MIVAGNWKMNLDLNEAIHLSNELLKYDKTFLKGKVIVFPTFLFIPHIFELFKNSKISIGAQDCSMYNNGAITGQVSAEMINKAGCSYVIVGHSERRSLCYETSTVVSQKARRAISVGLKTILTDQEKGQTILLKWVIGLEYRRL